MSGRRDFNCPRWDWSEEEKEKRDNHFASRQATQWPGYKCSWQQDDGYLASSFHQGNYAGNVDNRSLWSLAWAPKRWINGIVWVTPFHYFLTPAVITDQWQIPDGDRERSKQRANIDEWFVVTSNFGFANADTNALHVCWYTCPRSVSACAGLFSLIHLMMRSRYPPPPSPGGSLTVTDSGVERSAQHCDHYLIALPGTLLTLETDNWPGCLMWLMSDPLEWRGALICSPLSPSSENFFILLESLKS